MKHGSTRLAAALLIAVPGVASAASDIAMHRDPGCGDRGHGADPR